MLQFFKRRNLRKGELMNVDVDLVSLLFDDMKPANMRGAIIKSANGNHTTIYTSDKFKSERSGTKGLIYVTVMEPDVKDLQGDFYSAAEVEKAAHSFAKGGMVNRNDVNHNSVPVPEFSVGESYILKTKDNEHFPETKVGSWVMVLKCDDLNSETWQKVEKGRFNGVSIAGRADQLVTADPDTQTNAAVLAELKSLKERLEKAIAVNPTSADSKSLALVNERIADLEKQGDQQVSNELMKTLTSELRAINTSISKAISTSLKNEEPPADQEVMIDGQKVIVKASRVELYKSIANVDAGTSMNILTPTTTSLFIDEVIESKPGDTLTDITVLPLMKDERVDVGLIDDLVFTNSQDTPGTAQSVGMHDLQVPTGILTAEFKLSRDTVEFYKDKFGEAAFGAYVNQHIARKTEKALRKLLFKGSRSSTTPALKALNGVVQLATTANKVVNIDPADYVNWAEQIEAALLSFSDDVLEEQEQFVIYVSQKDHVRLAGWIAKRETPAGDKFLLDGGKISYGGIPVKPRLLDDNYLVVGLAKFIIIGVRTDAEMKIEHHGSDWNYHWYIRIRPGITYVDGFAKVFNITTTDSTTGGNGDTGSGDTGGGGDTGSGESDDPPTGE